MISETELLKLLAGLAKRRAGPPCPNCGHTYLDFKETGRFGCSVCYDHFAPLVRSLLPRLL